MKTLNLEQMENTKAGGFFHDLMNCYGDAYTQHGLSSFGLAVCTIALPETGLLVMAGCVVKVNLDL